MAAVVAILNVGVRRPRPRQAPIVASPARSTSHRATEDRRGFTLEATTMERGTDVARSRPRPVRRRPRPRPPSPPPPRSLRARDVVALVAFAAAPALAVRSDRLLGGLRRSTSGALGPERAEEPAPRRRGRGRPPEYLRRRLNATDELSETGQTNDDFGDLDGTHVRMSPFGLKLEPVILPLSGPPGAGREMEWLRLAMEARLNATFEAEFEDSKSEVDATRLDEGRFAFAKVGEVRLVNFDADGGSARRLGMFDKTVDATATAGSATVYVNGGSAFYLYGAGGMFMTAIPRRGELDAVVEAGLAGDGSGGDYAAYDAGGGGGLAAAIRDAGPPAFRSVARAERLDGLGLEAPVLPLPEDEVAGSIAGAVGGAAEGTAGGTAEGTAEGAADPPSSHSFLPLLPSSSEDGLASSEEEATEEFAAWVDQTMFQPALTPSAEGSAAPSPGLTDAIMDALEDEAAGSDPDADARGEEEGGTGAEAEAQGSGDDGLYSIVSSSSGADEASTAADGSKGSVAFVVVGVLAVLFALIVGAVLLVRYRRREKYESERGSAKGVPLERLTDDDLCEPDEYMEDELLGGRSDGSARRSSGGGGGGGAANEGRVRLPLFLRRLRKADETADDRGAGGDDGAEEEGAKDVPMAQLPDDEVVKHYGEAYNNLYRVRQATDSPANDEATGDAADEDVEKAIERGRAAAAEKDVGEGSEAGSLDAAADAVGNEANVTADTAADTTASSFDAGEVHSGDLNVSRSQDLDLPFDEGDGGGDLTNLTMLAAAKMMANDLEMGVAKAGEGDDDDGGGGEWRMAMQKWETDEEGRVSEGDVAKRESGADGEETDEEGGDAEGMDYGEEGSGVDTAQDFAYSKMLANAMDMGDSGANNLEDSVHPQFDGHGEADDISDKDGSDQGDDQTEDNIAGLREQRSRELADLDALANNLSDSTFLEAPTAGTSAPYDDVKAVLALAASPSGDSADRNYIGDVNGTDGFVDGVEAVKASRENSPELIGDGGDVGCEPPGCATHDILKDIQTAAMWKQGFQDSSGVDEGGAGATLDEEAEARNGDDNDQGIPAGEDAAKTNHIHLLEEGDANDPPPPPPGHVVSATRYADLIWACGNEEGREDANSLLDDEDPPAPPPVLSRQHARLDENDVVVNKGILESISEVARSARTLQTPSPFLLKADSFVPLTEPVTARERSNAVSMSTLSGSDSSSSGLARVPTPEVPEEVSREDPPGKVAPDPPGNASPASDGEGGDSEEEGEDSLFDELKTVQTGDVFAGLVTEEEEEADPRGERPSSAPPGLNITFVSDDDDEEEDERDADGGVSRPWKEKWDEPFGAGARTKLVSPPVVAPDPDGSTRSERYDPDSDWDVDDAEASGGAESPEEAFERIWSSHQ
ncbi:hypothetical protein ACHAWF_006934, partial [Thalassiosira exigua]